MLVHIASISSTSYLAHHIVPAGLANARQETWTEASLYQSFSYLCVLQITGLLLIAGTVLLKWTFVAPYVTDRIAKWTLAHLFPFATRDIVTAIFFQLYGLKINLLEAVSTLHVRSVAPSKAHLVQFGAGVFAANPEFAPGTPPGTAKTVWGWLWSRGALKSPWGYQVDIDLPEGFEMSFGSRIESGALLEKGAAGTAMMARVRKGDQAGPGKLVGGNPVSLKIDVRKEESQVNRTSTFLLAGHTGLQLLHMAYVGCAALVTIESMRSLPIFDWPDYLYPVVVMVLGMNFLYLILALEIVLLKRIIVGRARTRSFGFVTLDLLLLLQAQNVQRIPHFFELYAGLFPVNLLHRALGVTVDLTTVLINEYPWVDGIDGDLIKLREWSVMDTGSVLAGHNVTRGQVHHETLEVQREAVMHPMSRKFFGSVGANSCVMPHSVSLKTEHLPADSVFVGAPGMQATVVTHSPSGKTTPGDSV